MKTFKILLLLAFVPLTIQAQLLWKISGNGLAQPSYIFGTHHLAKLSILDSIKGYKEAFKSAVQVVGEIDTKEMMAPATLALMQKRMMIDNDTTLQMLLTPANYIKVTKCINDNFPQIPIEILKKMRPAALTNNLEMILYMKQFGDFNVQEQLDSHFQKEGLANNKKIIGLETIEQQFDILYNSCSLRRQAELLVCLIDNIREETQETLALTAYYNNQKLNEMYVLSQKKHGDNCDDYPSELNALIYNRNKNWISKLPAILTQGSSFIAVGALHLPGPDGLLTLLRKAGYKVTPVL